MKLKDMHEEDLMKVLRPKFRHVGYVVKDIRSAADKLSACFPMMDPWRFCVICIPETETHDHKRSHLIVGLSRVNGNDIELVQAMPDCQDCWHASLPDWAAHVSYVYPGDRYQEVYEYLMAHEHKIIWASDQGYGERCYFYQHKDGGPMLEFNNLFPGDPDYATLDEALANDPVK